MHLTANISVPQKNFIAIDLHSDNAVICVRRNALNKAGELVGKNIWCGRVSIRDGLDNFIKVLVPHCQDFDHVAVVESTYNWYCLADAFEERGWLLRVADPSTVSQANLKSSDDRIEAQYLAERQRVGSLKHYLPLNYSSRALRDLCRYRMAMVQDCASLKIKLSNLYRNQLSKNVRVADLLERCQPHMQPNYRFNSDSLEEFKDRNIRLRVAFEISRIAMLEEMIEECNAEIQKQCKDQELVKLCKTIPGCGPVLSAVICTEIGTRQKQGPGQSQKRQRLLEMGFYRSRSICLQKPCDSGDFATSAAQIRRSESQGHSNLGRKNSSSDFLCAQKQTAVQCGQMLRH